MIIYHLNYKSGSSLLSMDYSTGADILYPNFKQYEVSRLGVVFVIMKRNHIITIFTVRCFVMNAFNDAIRFTY